MTHNHNNRNDTSKNDSSKSGFSKLGLIEPIRRVLAAENYANPTPIQARAIPLLLDGKDLLGIAQTGTGKTAAFALPILQQLSQARAQAGPRAARALVLAPTRELAIQIAADFRNYGRRLKLSQAVIYGGVGHKPQITALKRGVDVLVATPGRLLDLLEQGHLRLDGASHLVLDEADRMLDMGFISDVRRIVRALPRKRQTMLFSATMPAEVARLAGEILDRPVRVEVARAATPVEKIAQRVYHVGAGAKRALLAELLDDPALARVIVFTRTKHRANRVAEQLDKAGFGAEAIHGNKSQGARQRALDDFKAGRVRVLVATDIAARGIDVDGISHVINYELPNEPESYVHRIGRTARAGAAGAAIAFCDPAERSYLRAIEQLTKARLTVLETPAGLAGDAGAARGKGMQRTRSGPAPAARSGKAPAKRRRNNRGKDARRAA